MFEKCNPGHPDKVADRIAGAIVDLAYENQHNPKIAVEVLIGHHNAFVIIEADESTIDYVRGKVTDTVYRITKSVLETKIIFNKQDDKLSNNQNGCIKCGDNGIFKGCQVTREQRQLVEFAKQMYNDVPYDGKYLIGNTGKLTICQSNFDLAGGMGALFNYKNDMLINPLGYWTGGLDVDTGATNRKLGSDMGDAVTGGGLHGKDLSKADVSINIYLHLKANKDGDVAFMSNRKNTITASCSIGDEYIDGKPYSEIVDIARNYIKEIGGFEKFAEWGLIR